MPSLVHPFWGYTDHGHCSAAKAQLGKRAGPPGVGLWGVKMQGQMKMKFVLCMKFEISRQSKLKCMHTGAVRCGPGMGEGVVTTGRGWVQIQCDKCDGVRQ